MTSAAKDLPVKREAAAVEKAGPPDILALMQFALEKGKTEDLERLVDLHQRMEDRAASREFNEALARFQAECPSIFKTGKATIPSDSGRSFSYTYAELDSIATTARPYLHKRGLSFGWDFETDDKDRSYAVCTLRHVNGHTNTARFPIIVDSRANKALSDSQKMAAPTKFACRQSLIMVLGLTACDEDTDGASRHASPEKISESQAADLAALAQEVKADLPRLLKYAGVKRIEDIGAGMMPGILQKLEEKRRRG